MALVVISSIVAVAAAGCSGDSQVAPADGGTVDREAMDRPCFLAPDAAMPFLSCPSRHDDTSWKTAFCDALGIRFLKVYEQTCTGYLYRDFRYSVHGIACYYSPETGALIAGRTYEDVLTYCDRTSSDISTGAVPVPGTCTPESPAPVFDCGNGDIDPSDVAVSARRAASM